jgi:hypothetical protein
MTTQATHTPGPWEKQKRGRELDICDSGAGEPMLRRPWQTCKNAKANARLIAAAPDLLEALRGLLRETRQSVPNINVKKHFSLMVQMEEAKSAIAKAEGRAE